MTFDPIYPLSVCGIGNDRRRVVTLDNRNRGFFIYQNYHNVTHQKPGTPVPVRRHI